jgi:hypothetical protein
LVGAMHNEPMRLETDQPYTLCFIGVSKNL